MLDSPVIRDVVVLGASSSVRVQTIQELCACLGQEFETIDVADDPTIGHIIVRSALLHKVPASMLVPYVVSRVGPIMNESEAVILDLDTELEIEDRI